MNFNYLILIVICIILSCNDQDIDLNLVNEGVNIKLKQRQEEKIANCKEDTKEKAEKYIDSLIAINSSLAITDSLYFPARPTRDTNSKNYNIRIDSINVKKIRDSLFKK